VEWVSGFDRNTQFDNAAGLPASIREELEREQREGTSAVVGLVDDELASGPTPEMSTA
jgi:hypothetical protein